MKPILFPLTLNDIEDIKKGEPILYTVFFKKKDLDRISNISDEYDAVPINVKLVTSEELNAINSLKDTTNKSER